MLEVKLFGRIDDEGFQRCLAAAKWAESAKHIQLEIHAMFEFEWALWLNENKSQHPIIDEMPFVVMIHEDSDEEYQAFWTFCEEKFNYEESEETNYTDEAKKARLDRMKKSKNDFCRIKLSYADEPIETPLVIEVYTSKLPKTCENFKNLCNNTVPEKSYKNSLVHRIVPSGWVQMGDTQSGSKGDGGHSSFDQKCFADETFAISHDCRGRVGMANCGPHTNQSQFYITLEAKHYLDKRFVCFGNIIEGSSTLAHLETIETFNERPVKPVVITETEVINLEA